MTKNENYSIKTLFKNKLDFTFKAAKISAGTQCGGVNCDLFRLTAEEIVDDFASTAH